MRPASPTHWLHYPHCYHTPLRTATYCYHKNKLPQRCYKRSVYSLNPETLSIIWLCLFLSSSIVILCEGGLKHLCCSPCPHSSTKLHVLSHSILHSLYFLYIHLEGRAHSMVIGRISGVWETLSPAFWEIQLQNIISLPCFILCWIPLQNAHCQTQKVSV